MAKKIGAARRAIYFRALGETGNLSIAAERARVSLTWAKRLRRCDAAFAARFDATLAAARARLGASGGVKPPRGWGSLDGEELVVRSGNGRDVQIVRARLKQWTPRVEARFLTVLAATCNVTASAHAVGMSPASAYHHASRWPDFATRWRAAIDEGYFRIETQLLERATRGLSPAATGVRGDTAGTGADSREASDDALFHQLYMHQHAVAQRGKAPGRRIACDPARQAAARSDMVATLSRNLARIERRKAHGPLADEATRAADRREWTRRGAP